MEDKKLTEQESLELITTMIHRTRERYIGDGNMIHAPQTGDVVKVSSINTEYRISQYAGAVRVY